MIWLFFVIGCLLAGGILHCSNRKWLTFFLLIGYGVNSCIEYDLRHPQPILLHEFRDGFKIYVSDPPNDDQPRIVISYDYGNGERVMGFGLDIERGGRCPFEINITPINPDDIPIEPEFGPDEPTNTGVPDDANHSQ